MLKNFQTLLEVVEIQIKNKNVQNVDVYGSSLIKKVKVHTLYTSCTLIQIKANKINQFSDKYFCNAFTKCHHNPCWRTNGERNHGYRCCNSGENDYQQHKLWKEWGF